MSEEITPYLTRADLGKINADDRLTDRGEPDTFGEINDRCDMCEQVERLASRHIAKLLTRLGSTIPPVVEQEIKRQFRFFSNDVISVIQGEQNDDHENRFNR